MVYVRTGDHVVEVIKPGNKKGKSKVFRKKKNALKYANSEYKKGKNVYVDLILKYGQHPYLIKEHKKKKKRKM